MNWFNKSAKRHPRTPAVGADRRQPAGAGAWRGPQGEFEAQYHYDALGRRSRKAVRYKGKTEQTTRFLWQGYRLLQEQRDDGSRRS